MLRLFAQRFNQLGMDVAVRQIALAYALRYQVRFSLDAFPIQPADPHTYV